MLKILHLSDLHLGWQPAFLAPERASAWQIRRDGILGKAVDHALAQDIPIVVIAGNLFDRHDPPAPVVESALTELRRLVEGGRVLITVPGPRDGIVYPDSVYRKVAGEWPGTLVTSLQPTLALRLAYGEETILVYGMACSGAPVHAGRVITSFPRADEPGFHLAILPGALDDTSSPCLPRLDADALAAAGYAYVALGGLPQFNAIALGQTVAAWPGSVESRGFDRPGAGRFTVVERADGAGVQVTTTPVPIGSLVSRTIDVTGMNDDSEIVAMLGKWTDPDALARIVLRGIGRRSLPFRELESRLADRYFHLEIVDETTLDLEAARSDDSPAGRLAGLLAGRLEATRDPAERAALEGALREGMAMLRKEVPAR